MPIIQNNIKIDEGAANKMLAFLVKLIKNLFKQPKWLILLAVLAIVGGAAYFKYSIHTEKEKIQGLYENVQIINDITNKTLNIEDYKKNLLNVITTIKLLQQENQQSFDDNILEINLLISFIEKHHPKDPIVNDLRSMKNRLIINHDIYKEHYDYTIKQLDEFVINVNKK